jgi:pimeloyl-ACP methyl ester carboxylesterase
MHPRAAPTLVFLHYWGGSHRTFDLVISALACNCTVVTFDQRGSGASRDLRGPYGLEQLASDALDVARAVADGPCVLVGHSMGGKVALLAAARRPAGLVGLVLIAPSPPKPTIDVDTARQRAHAYDDEASVKATIARALTHQPLSDELQRQVLVDSLAWNEGARTVWPLEGILADITDATIEIGVPTLVIAGALDRVDPPSSLESHLLPYVPTARMVTVEGTGHLSPLEAPHRVAAHIDHFVFALQ